MAQPPRPAHDTWCSFINHALATRLPAQQFASFARLLNTKHSLPSIRICDLILQPYDGDATPDSLDPLVPSYLVDLIREGLVEVSDCLRALRRYNSWRTSSTTQKNEQQSKKRWKRSYIGDEAVINALTKQISNCGQTPKREKEAIELIKATTEWVEMLINVNDHMASHMDDFNQQAPSQEQQTEIMAVRVALGMLIVSVAENPVALKSLQKGCPKGISHRQARLCMVIESACCIPWILLTVQGIIKDFSHGLTLFAPTIVNSSQPGIAERIELFRTQTLVPLEPVDKKTQAANDEINQLLESTIGLGMDSIPVVDLPVQNFRAGLYVYLNSLV